jgi:hypothetical protein
VTATLTPPPPPPTSEDAPRRPIVLVAAAVVAVLTVVVVLVFGVVRPPELATFDDPAFDGAMAVATWEDDWCVQVVDGDGARELTCDRDGGELVAWTGDGIEVLRWLHDREELVTLDPATGDAVARRDVSDDPGDESWWVEPDIDTVTVRDGTLEVELDGEVLWRVETRDPYEVTSGWVGPDGDWVVLQDSADRLLLVPADGSAPPAVLAEDVSAYATLVWREAGVTSRG